MKKLASKFMTWLGFVSDEEMKKIRQETARLRKDAAKLTSEIEQLGTEIQRALKEIRETKEDQKLTGAKRVFPETPRMFTDEEHEELKRKLENYLNRLPYFSPETKQGMPGNLTPFTTSADILSPMRRFGPDDPWPHGTPINVIIIDETEEPHTAQPLRSPVTEADSGGAHALGDGDFGAQGQAQGADEGQG